MAPTKINRFIRELFILLALLGLYLIGTLFLEVQLNESTMFNAFHPDADTFSYLDAGQGILSGETNGNLLIRPYLFSCLIAVLYKATGFLGIYVLQVIALVLANYFTVKSIYLATKKISISIIGAIVFGANLSLVYITFFALTEPLIVLGLSIIIYQVVLNQNEKIQQPKFWRNLLVILISLALIKPVFLWPCFGMTFILIISLFSKNRPQFDVRSKYLMLLAYILLLFQFGIMRYHAGEFTFSKIGGITLRNYLTVQVYAKNQNLSRPIAFEEVQKFSKGEMIQILTNDPLETSEVFFENIVGNIQSDPIMQDYNDESVNKMASQWMKKYNETLLYLCILLFALTIIWMIKKRSAPVLLLVLLLLYLILVTGIADSQRDRLIVPLTSLWIFLLIYMIHAVLSKSRKNETQ